MKIFQFYLILLLLVFCSQLTAQHESLDVKLECSEYVFVYKSIDCKISLTNKGKTIENILVVFRTSLELRYISAQPRAYRKLEKYSEKNGWIISSLQTNETKTITVTLRGTRLGLANLEVSVFLSPELLNQRGVVPNITRSQKIKVLGINNNTSSTYDTEDPVEVGYTTTYVIEPRNEGTSKCTGVVIENIIPEEMEYVSAVGPTKYFYDSKRRAVIFEPVAELQPGEKLTYRITCRALEEGSAKNTAIMRYNEFDKPILDEEGTSIYK